jgi:hypothetical protein
VIYAARSGMDADHGGMSSGLDTKSSLVKEKNIFLAVCLLGINQALSMLG